MLTATIMQPAYLPWLGYFDRINQSDVFVLLDDVEIDRNSKTKFANRNKIRTPTGWTWLTVPIKTKGQRGQLRLDRIEIDNESSWARKHWTSIQHNYAKAPYFSDYAEQLEDLFGHRWSLLTQLTDAFFALFYQSLALRAQVVRSSELTHSETKSDLILEISQLVGADTYLSGPFGRNYLDLNAFTRAGVEVKFHDYEHPVYAQIGEGFESHLSVLDLLLNHGPKSLKILAGDRCV